jgi:hypothetical protein
VSPNAALTVDLSGTVELVQRHVTDALCQEAWQEVREAERQREWTLEMLVRFWTSVTLDPPRSLRHALAQASVGERSRYPAPSTSPQAFFARCHDLRWEFFAAVFRRFTSSVSSEARSRFARELEAVRARFASVQAVDGSNLDAVARRLKVVWRERAAVLPGTILAFYDICSGTMARLVFDPNVSGSEFVRASEALDGATKNTLLVGDALYGVPRWFAALGERGLFGVTRRHGAGLVVRMRLNGRHDHNGGILEDWEAVVGSGVTVESQILRLIVWKRGGRIRLQLLTNVLDPAALSAMEAMTVFRWRWKVERLFSDLKEVLNLRRFYGANVNAVGMQVFAAAIVHTALRVAQGRVAEAAKVEPERISTKKFFPRVAAAACLLTGIECGFEMTRRANPGVELVRPDYRKAPGMRARVADLLVKPRTGRRRKWRPPKQAWRQLAPQPRRRKRTK